MRATLKRSLGEAGAFICDSHGSDRLYDVLKALAMAGGDLLTATVATPSVAVAATLLVDQPTRLASFAIDVGTCGSANTTTVVVTKNGTAITGATISVANTAADGTSVVLDASDFGDVELDPGDLVAISVTAVATDVANLNAAVRLNPVKVEA